MLDSLKVLLKGTVPAVRPALMTALFTFLAVLSAALVDWMSAVSGWLSVLGTPEASEFPDPSILGQALFAGVTAAGTGFVNYLVRAVQALRGIGSVPSYGG